MPRVRCGPPGSWLPSRAPPRGISPKPQRRPPHLGRQVVLDGRRFSRTDPEADHAYRRDVQLRAADLEPFLGRTRRLKLEALAR